MAIQLDIQQSQFGIPFAGAYFRVITASVMRQRTDAPRHTVMIDVAGYATQPGSEDVQSIDFRRYHAPLADVEGHVADTFLSKVYAWVMAQPDMAGSVAC